MSDSMPVQSPAVNFAILNKTVSISKSGLVNFIIHFICHYVY